MRELIVRIPEACKCFPDSDSGKLVHVRFSLQYTHLFPESGSRKHFQDSRMRAIDSRMKLPPEI
jgi:hypothetical protein